MRTLRLTFATVLVVLAAAAPAQAISPSPTELDFDDVAGGTDVTAVYNGRGIHMSVTATDGTPDGCGGTVQGPASDRFLEVHCTTKDPLLRVQLPSTQFWVGMKVEDTSIPARMAGFFPSGTDEVTSMVQNQPSADPPRDPWYPPLSVASGGAAQIRFVTLRPWASTVHTSQIVRTLAYSTSPQPDVEIAGKPALNSSDLTPTFTLASSTSGPIFSCTLDNVLEEPCDPRYTPTVTEGHHSLWVQVISDDYDLQSRSVNYQWDVDATPPVTLLSVEPASSPFPPGSETIHLSNLFFEPVTYECALDGAGFGACPDNNVYLGLALGDHVLQARATDLAGNRDETPAEARWTYALPDPDSDGDGIRDSVDNCRTTVNFNQADADGDGIGDACEADFDRDGVADDRDNCRTTPNFDQDDTDDNGIGDACEPDTDGDGEPDFRDNCPRKANRSQIDSDEDGVGDACDPLGRVTTPRAGSDSTVRVLSGTVLVFRDGEFIPVTGAGNAPLNTDVDATKGRISVRTAVAFNSSETQNAQLAAGIFRVKQRRAKGQTAQTDVNLRTPANAAKLCASKATRPAKGIVRRLSIVTKGRFRMVGAVASATVRKASVTVSDTCSGTRVKVNRGKATIAVKGRKKPLTLKAGKTFLAKARLFGAKKRKS